jgi:hypothetical protein
METKNEFMALNVLKVELAIKLTKGGKYKVIK